MKFRVNLNDTADPKNNFEWSALESSPLKVIQKVEIPAKSKSADGQHSWTLSVTDLAGNTTTKNYSAGIDKTPPVISISTDAPSLIVTNTINIQITINEANKINKIEYGGNGRYSIMFPPYDTYYSFNPSYSSFNNGANTYSVRVTDEAGNIGEKTISLNWHLEKPIITYNSTNRTFTSNTALTVLGSKATNDQCGGYGARDWYSISSTMSSDNKAIFLNRSETGYSRGFELIVKDAKGRKWTVRYDHFGTTGLGACGDTQSNGATSVLF